MSDEYDMSKDGLMKIQSVRASRTSPLQIENIGKGDVCKDVPPVRQSIHKMRNSIRKFDARCNQSFICYIEFH